MGEQRQIRSRSWNRMPTKRCTANGVTNEFILVDDDEVIILDFPESSKSTSRTGNESILQRVISIDDDDDTENVHKAGTSGNLQTSAEVDNDDCQFIHEKCADFRFSRCQQQDFSSGIRFGLASESESDYSDSDCSDCEIFEGSDREVREQWEKASSKKMKKAGLSEEAGPSNPNFGPGFKSRTEQHDQTSFLFQARNPDGGKETSSTFFTTGSRNHNTSPFGFFSKPDFPGPSSLTPEVQVEHERSDLPPTEFTWKKAPTHENSFKEVEEQPDTVQVRCETSQSSKENQNAAGQTCDGVGDTTPQSNGARRKHGISSLGESREPIIDSITSTSGHRQGLHGTAPEVDIILNREMLKETDEYKKAQEEEWESRQRQLQLQAEESQRQRKRIKLANKRQLEMERRQKERVEEVRETQKKDEESMNMKEKVRAEITKSLKLLELKSFNMASLLRGLGIPVGGGASPLPHEVHTAYKRAVLKFHPDRASRGDIKQQVEAEEKFKLIARMKDKFLL